MNELIEVHPPCTSKGVLGCAYDNATTVVCLFASSNKRFKKKGIVKGSILFVQPDLPFEEGKLNVFKSDDSYSISEEREDKEFFGRTIMVINQYE